MERFIVGVDGSSGSEDALRWAQREARIRDATVAAVLVWDLLDQYHADGGRRFDPHYDDRAARKALDAVIARALGHDADDVVRRVVCDLPVRGLLDAAEEADLLVVGARGIDGFRGLVMGSVSQRCLEHAPCPVAVVRGRDEEHGRVVVGVDGSDGAAAALHWAVEEARLRAATLTVVHGWEVPYAGEITYLADVQEACERAAIELVDDMVEAAGLDAEQVERCVVHDPPVHAIADAAAEADLVVVGSRGRGGFTGLLLGSVSHQVGRHSNRPVVVVPDTAP